MTVHCQNIYFQNLIFTDNVAHDHVKRFIIFIELGFFVQKLSLKVL